MPARKLGKADAGFWGRSRDANGSEDVMRRERRLKQSLEECIGLDHTRTLWTRNLDLAAERKQASWQLGGRIREGQRTSEGPAIAYRRMSNMRHRQCNERRMTMNFG